MSVSLPILEPKAFALPTSHRIDNAEAHASTDYIINRYIETNQTQTPCCHLPAVMLRVCEVLGSQRQTFENVFLIYKTVNRLIKILPTMLQKYKKFVLPPNFIQKIFNFYTLWAQTVYNFLTCSCKKNPCTRDGVQGFIIDYFRSVRYSNN